MEPAEFALIINNKGNGDATNVKMVTNQPEIIDNQKGLLIDFEFISSQLNGQDKTLALGQSIPTDFGTIPAHTQAYALPATATRTCRCSTRLPFTNWFVASRPLSLQPSALSPLSVLSSSTT